MTHTAPGNQICTSKIWNDSTKFSAHSTRVASAFKAKEKDVRLDTILSTVGWRSAETFQKFCSVQKIGGQYSREAIVVSSQIGLS